MKKLFSILVIAGFFVLAGALTACGITGADARSSAARRNDWPDGTCSYCYADGYCGAERCDTENCLYRSSGQNCRNNCARNNNQNRNCCNTPRR